MTLPFGRPQMPDAAANWPKLQISGSPEAHLLRLADDQMIVQRDAKRAAGSLYLKRHRDICLRRRRVAAGMVMQLSTHLIHHIDK